MIHLSCCVTHSPTYSATNRLLHKTWTLPLSTRTCLWAKETISTNPICKDFEKYHRHLGTYSICKPIKCVKPSRSRQNSKEVQKLGAKERAGDTQNQLEEIIFLRGALLGNRQSENAVTNHSLNNFQETNSCLADKFLQLYSIYCWGLR